MRPLACDPCTRFFARFTCGRLRGYDECDCPKCQGYCECDIIKRERAEIRRRAVKQKQRLSEGSAKKEKSK